MQDYRKDAIKEALKETKKDLFRISGVAVVCIIIAALIEGIKGGIF